MPNIRIKDIPTTASASSSTDFLALDGSANGTRKLNAYSPTFGGNLTVSGTTASSSTSTGALVVGNGTSGGLGVGGAIYAGGTIYARSAGSNVRLYSDGTDAKDGYVGSSGGGIVALGHWANPELSISLAGNTSLTGNLTVSGSISSTGNGVANILLSSGSGYNVVSLNNSTTFASTVGMFGAASGDNNLYINAPTGREVDIRINNTNVAQFTGTTTTLAGNLTVSGGTVTSGTGTLTLNSSANTVVLQSAGTTALTLDSSQRAQFAGNLGLGAGPLSYMGIRNSLSLTASSGVAYVYQSGGTLTTSANNDQIFGMSIDNGYSNTGSYTNISAGHLQINAQSFSGIAFGYGIRIGNITGATNNYAIRTGSGIVSFEDTTASTATNSGALRVSGGVGVAGAINVGTFYGMVDGVTAPSATSGYAKIYVDTADGDLKVIFGDGTIKTIATDS